jgi:hypothetical protein
VRGGYPLRRGISVGTTLLRFVENMVGVSANSGADALRLWMRRQAGGERVVVCEGSEEELHVTTEDVEGEGRPCREAVV